MHIYHFSLYTTHLSRSLSLSVFLSTFFRAPQKRHDLYLLLALHALPLRSCWIVGSFRLLQVYNTIETIYKRSHRITLQWNKMENPSCAVKMLKRDGKVSWKYLKYIYIYKFSEVSCCLVHSPSLWVYRSVFVFLTLYSLYNVLNVCVCAFTRLACGRARMR